MVQLFKKKCAYCEEKIEKGKEVWDYVKVPEFLELKKKPFCKKEHAEKYKSDIIGTPSSGGCLRCTNA